MLAHERQLASLFYRATEHGDVGHRERIREICEDDGVLLRLLRSALSEHRSQTVGDLAVRSTPALPWESLAEIVGGEAALKRRLDEIRARVDPDELDDRTRLALETAERYRTGQPPDDRF